MFQLLCARHFSSRISPLAAASSLLPLIRNVLLTRGNNVAIVFESSKINLPHSSVVWNAKPFIPKCQKHAFRFYCYIFISRKMYSKQEHDTHTIEDTNRTIFNGLTWNIASSWHATDGAKVYMINCIRRSNGFLLKHLLKRMFH